VCPVSGRKPAQESRATEFRRRLIAWKQTPEWLRPSLRALARELRTSHQLLTHYLDGLEKWRYKERYRKAKKESEEIRARASAEGRQLTPWEAQQLHGYTIASLRAQAASEFLDSIKRIKRDAKRGPLHREQIKMLRLFARIGFPEAQELLQECSQVGPKERNGFTEIVKETPRQEGETCIAWVRRILDQCAKYDTKCPAVITEKLLKKYSQGSAKSQQNNLPSISTGAAKSFRTTSENAEEGWQLR
jgi:hypothetical protein